MKTAIIYARHITLRKKEDDISTQVFICKDYAKRNNLEIIKIYADCSNCKLKSYIDFENMIEEVKTLKPNKIILSSMLILGRYLKQIKKFINACKKRKVEVVFVDYEENPYSKLLKNLLKRSLV